MTRSAAPLANSAFAICSIMRPWVRSLIPISTAPLPIGMHVAALERRRPEVG